MLHLLFWVGAISAMGWTVQRPQALACSGSTCTAPEFFPARGQVPANLPAILYWPVADRGFPRSDPPWFGLRFVRITDTGFEDVPFRVENGDELTARWLGLDDDFPAMRIIPSAPLQPGSQYALWSDTCAGEASPMPPRASAPTNRAGLQSPAGAERAVFEVVAEAPLPTALGPIELGALAKGAVTFGGGASCSQSRETAYVTAQIDFDAGVWANALAFRTIVDGQTYRPIEQDFAPPGYGASWTGRGSDRLAVICDVQGPLTEGTHTLQFEARVAGSDDILTTAPVQFELSCDPDVIDPGSGCSSTGGPQSTGAGFVALVLLMGAGRVIARRRLRLP